MTDQWITWALQGLIVGAVSFVWKQIIGTTKAINDLRLELTKDYVSMHRWETEWSEVRRRLHDMENWRAGEIAKEELLKRQQDLNK